MKFGLHWILGVLTAVATMSVASSALACRTIVPKASELATHKNLVVAGIDAAERLENSGWNTWRLTARKLNVVAGRPGPVAYTFSTTQSSDGCGITPLPLKGEKWVIYPDASDPDKVLAAFPLSLARDYDPRLATVR